MIRLPAGLIWEGECHREVELGPVTGAVRREILSLQGQKHEVHKLHRKVLKRVVQRIGSLEPPNDEHILALPICDAEYILYELAKSLRGDQPFRAEGVCPECRNRSIYTVEWDEIIVRPLEETKFTEERTLPFVLKVGLKNTRTGVIGKRGFLRLYTLGDVEKFVRSQFSKGTDIGALDAGRMESSYILAMLHSLEGFDPSEDGDFTVEDLDRMDIRDYEILLETMRDSEPGVILPTRSCSSCGESGVRLTVDWITNFLLRTKS